MPFPDIDPIIFQIGPFALRWYALAYLAGLLLGVYYMTLLAKKYALNFDKETLDDFLTWAVFGVILGGRLGYVLFYQPGYYFYNPGKILQVWEGGMSFHGGVIGVTVAMILFAKKRKLVLFELTDLVSVAAPIGLFFGRIANFINGELFGRVTDVSWGVIFPMGGPEPRHPSQLYESMLEGFVLFFILHFLFRSKNLRNRPGFMTGVFLIGYAIARMIVEFFREPDAYLGFLFAGATMGQLLSVPMLALGVVLIHLSLNKPQKALKKP